MFGLTKPEAILSRKDCRGEEHEVELVWSTKKKKAKLFWNKRNVSNLWRQQGIDNAEFSWTTHSGEELHIVSQPIIKSQAMIEYDLLVDGVSFFDLPKARDMGKTLVDQMEDQRSPDDESARHQTCLPDTSDQWEYQSDPYALPPPTDSLGFRLSMAGLSSSASFYCGDKIHDELHSELYTPVLESLRLQITSFLPQTEEMVSRSIINAFFVDSNSLRSESSLLSDRTRERRKEGKDSYQAEVDYLLDAQKWVKAEGSQMPHSQYEDLALGFFQKRIDEIFVLIRDEKLTSDEAARILLSVATVLGLKFACPDMPKDTVFLNGLDKDLTRESLQHSLAEYGEVRGTAISTDRPSFGFCRFSTPESVTRLWEAYRDGSFVIDVSKPTVTPLTEYIHGDSDSNSLSPTFFREEQLESLDSPESSAIPHLMAPLSLEDTLLLDSPVSVARYIVSTDVVEQIVKKRDQDGRSYSSMTAHSPDTENKAPS